MVAPLSEVPKEGSSVFSLFSLIKLHLASLPLASSYSSRVAVSSVFCPQNIFFGPNAWGPVKGAVYTVVVVVVFFTLTDRASTISSTVRGCQSGTWSQRGTNVNGSHNGDNPLLRPKGIQIATKSYATLQAMAPTNNKTVHQTSFTPYREQHRSTRVVVAFPRPAFSATNRTNTFQPVLITIPSFSRPYIVQK